MKLYTILILTLCQFSIKATEQKHSREPELKNCQGTDFEVSYVQIFEMLTQLVVTWIAPECGDARLEYILEYSNGQTTETVETEDTFFYFNYTANGCFDDVITITAVADGVSGNPVTTAYNSLDGIPGVENISGNHSSDAVFLQWEPPKELSQCDLNYKIELQVNDQFKNVDVHNELSVTIQDVYMKPCENATATITAIRDTANGSPVSKNISGEIGPVTNIVTDNVLGGDGFIDFDEPENTEVCNLKYAISYGPAVCFERNVSVTVFDRYGGQRTTTTVIAQQRAGPLENITARRIEERSVEVSWDEFEKVDDCHTKYYITVEANGSDWVYGYVNETVTNVYITACLVVNETIQARIWVAPYISNVMGIAGASPPVSVCGEEKGTVLDN